MANNNKPKRVGSAYFNLKKDSPKELQPKLRKAIEWMHSNGVRLNFSLKDGDNYVPFVSFVNSYKETNRDPDLIIYPVENEGRPVKEESRKSDAEDDGPPF